MNASVLAYISFTLFLLKEQFQFCLKASTGVKQKKFLLRLKKKKYIYPEAATGRLECS